jgi:hypothetical protein
MPNFSKAFRQELLPAINEQYSRFQRLAESGPAVDFEWFVRLIGRAESGQIAQLKEAGFSQEIMTSYFFFRDFSDPGKSLKFTIGRAQFEVFNTLQALGHAYRHASRA